MPVHQSQLLIQGRHEDVFAFFSNAENLETITPAELRFRILNEQPIEMKPGVRIDYQLRLLRIPFRWRTLIPVWEPPHRFVDVQEKGPYARWEHEHRFEAQGNRVLMTDTVHYTLPLGLLGRLALPFVRHKVESIFQHRNRVIREHFADAATESEEQGE